MCELASSLPEKLGRHEWSAIGGRMGCLWLKHCQESAQMDKAILHRTRYYRRQTDLAHQYCVTGLSKAMLYCMLGAMAFSGLLLVEGFVVRLPLEKPSRC